MPLPTASMTPTSRTSATGPASARPPATGLSHPASTSGPAEAAPLLMMLISKEDGVDHGVGALGRLNGALQGLLATPVNSVREHDDRFAALLLLHQFVGGQVNGIVKQSAASVVHPARTAGVRIRRRFAALPAVAVVPGRLQQRKRGLQFVTRGSEILEQLHLTVKMDEECLVLGAGQHLIQKTLAGSSLLIQNIPLTQAGVDKQADGE